MQKLTNSYECTGCMVCCNACHKQAIAVIKDREGFLTPQVDVPF